MKVRPAVPAARRALTAVYVTVLDGDQMKAIELPGGEVIPQLSAW